MEEESDQPSSPPMAPPPPPPPAPPPSKQINNNNNNSASSETLSDKLAQQVEIKKSKQTTGEVKLTWASPTDSLRKLKVVVMSDTHNHPDRVPVPEGDIFIHCGDFTNKGTAAEVLAFNKFLGTLPHKHKLVICGNHERELAHTANNSQKEIQQVLSNCTYLQDSGVTIEGIKFYGSPWTLSSMAFGLDSSHIASKWSKIPKDTDVLITHNPPMQILDLAWVGMKPSEAKANCGKCMKSHPGYRHWGCKDLAARVKEVSPKVHLFGHVHDDDGSLEKEGVMYINAAFDISAKCYYFDLYPELMVHKKKFFFF